MDIQLADFMESYPSWMSPKFQILLGQEKEFNELASPISEPKPKKGQYFKHQRFTHRFLRNFGNLLIMSQTGTGKTCEALGFPESIINELEKLKEGFSNVDMKITRYRRYLILVKGKSQVAELTNQLICACSDGKYVTDLVLDSDSEKTQKKRLKAELKKYGYEIANYIKFARKIARYPETESGNAQLAADYSNTIIMIDEAHNLSLEPGTKYKEKMDTYHHIHRLTHASPSNKTIVLTATPMINDPREVISLMNLILPLNGELPPKYDYKTAPPNDLRVLFPGMKKNLPNYKEASREEVATYFIGQMPEKMDIQKASLEDVEPFFRGKINYVRAADTGARPVEQGETYTREFKTSSGEKYTSNLTLYTSVMSDFQEKSYRQTMGKKDDENVESQKNKEIYIPARSASNFVFPDGSYGNMSINSKAAIKKVAEKRKKSPTKDTDPDTLEANIEEDIFALITEMETGKLGVKGKQAFSKYVTYDNGRFTASKELKRELKTLDQIRKYSTKYAAIIEKAVFEPGNAFIYEEFITGSGAIMLAICIESLELPDGSHVEEYNERDSIFISEEDTKYSSKRTFVPCPEREKDDFMIEKKERKARIKKKLRYGLYLDKMPETKLASMMSTVKSYENRHSAYIKIFITTRIGREGINLDNFTQVHLAGSGWNESANYQAISRVLRATSFQDLMNEKKREYVKKGKDPSTATIPVYIYKHAAVTKKNPEKSIDFIMYRTAEAKDIGNKKILRFMKQCSVSCQLHYDRNVRPTDKDNSVECDYQVCHYDCVDGTLPETLQYDNYNLLYANDVIEETMFDISELFQYQNVLSWDTIVFSLPQRTPRHIIMALERFISNKQRITDKFGYYCYIREIGDTYYLDRLYPQTTSFTSPLDAYYTNYVIGLEYNPLQDVYKALTFKKQEDILSEIDSLNVPSQKEEIKHLVDTLTIDGKASLIESIIKEHVVKPTKKTAFIISLFSKNIYHIREPITALRKAKEEAAPTKEVKRGRKKNIEKIEKISKHKIDEVLPEEKTSNYVWLHTIYSEEIERTAYAATSKFSKKEGRTRILEYVKDPVHATWRDIEGLELQVYNAYIQQYIENQTKKFEEKGVYGIIVSDKEFRIRDPETESKKSDSDARLKKRGRICTTWSRPDLIRVAWETQLTPPPLEKDAKGLSTKEEFIAGLTKLSKYDSKELKSWNKDKLLYFYQWYGQKKKWNRNIICDKLKEKMIEDNKIY